MFFAMFSDVLLDFGFEVVSFCVGCCVCVGVVVCALMCICANEEVCLGVCVSRCSWARPSCMICGRRCNLVVSVRLLSRTSVCFVVYRVYPALCAWLMAA